jgi:Domain of unknown function (DUF1906)
MSIQGVDYSWGRPDPSAIKRAGYLFALRYLATPASGKVIDLAERQALHAAGLGVGLVWETYASRPLEGAAAGQMDGVAARAQAKALGFPDGFPIFGAVDSDPPASEYPTIAAYLQAAGFDCYANAPTCQYMSDHGTCRHFWQHDWGGGTFDARHIHQRGQTTIGGAQVDINDAFETCCIWFPPGPELQPQAGGATVQKLDPPVHVNAIDVGWVVKPQIGGVYLVTPDGHVYAWGCPDIGMPAGQGYWGARTVLDVAPLGNNGFRIYGRLGMQEDGVYDYPGKS